MSDAIYPTIAVTSLIVASATVLKTALNTFNRRCPWYWPDSAPPPPGMPNSPPSSFRPSCSRCSRPPRFTSHARREVGEVHPVHRQKLADVRMLGLLQLVDRPEEDHFAFVQHHYAVGHLFHQIQVMRYDYRR